MAARSGIEVVAVTDHDTISGVPEALSAAGESSVRVIPGIELSIVHEPGTMHMLGYFPRYPEGLEGELALLQAGRNARLPLMLEKLSGLGMQVSAEEVREISGDGQVGRPHVARVMVARGYVSGMDEAFRRYLAKGMPAYVPKEKLTRTAALEMIRRHGGLAVLAHPFSLDMDHDGRDDLLAELADAGLAGIEIFYPQHTKAQKRLYKRLARKYDLLATGGTDFHGSGRLGLMSPGRHGIDGERLRLFEERLFG